MAICPYGCVSLQGTSCGPPSEPDPPRHDPVTGQKVGRLRNRAAVPLRHAVGHMRARLANGQAGWLGGSWQVIGIENIRTIRFQPLLLTADPGKGLASAMAEALAPALSPCPDASENIGW